MSIRVLGPSVTIISGHISILFSTACERVRKYVNDVQLTVFWGGGGFSFTSSVVYIFFSLRYSLSLTILTLINEEKKILPLKLWLLVEKAKTSACAQKRQGWLVTWLHSLGSWIPTQIHVRSHFVQKPNLGTGICGEITYRVYVHVPRGG